MMPSRYQCEFCTHYNGDSLCPCDCADFEFNEEYNFFVSDDWDLCRDLDMEGEPIHFQIIKRLWSKNVECLFVDIWDIDNVAFLVGCNARDDVIAGVLGLHRESVYVDYDHSFVILNLYQEQDIRKKEKS